MRAGVCACFSAFAPCLPGIVWYNVTSYQTSLVMSHRTVYHTDILKCAYNSNDDTYRCTTHLRFQRYQHDCCARYAAHPLRANQMHASVSLSTLTTILDSEARTLGGAAVVIAVAQVFAMHSDRASTHDVCNTGACALQMLLFVLT